MHTLKHFLLLQITTGLHVYTSYGQCSLFGDFIFEPSNENGCWIDGEHGEYYYPLTESLGRVNVRHSWSRDIPDTLIKESYFPHKYDSFMHSKTSWFLFGQFLKAVSSWISILVVLVEVKKKLVSNLDPLPNKSNIIYIKTLILLNINNKSIKSWTYSLVNG